jgi:hypothetical protein
MLQTNPMHHIQPDIQNNINSSASDFISSAGHIIGSVCCFPDVLTNIITSYIDISLIYNTDFDEWHINKYNIIDGDIHMFNYTVYYTYLLNSSMLILGFACKSQYGSARDNIVCLFNLRNDDLTFIRYGYITTCFKISDDCISMHINQSKVIYRLIHSNLYFDRNNFNIAAYTQYVNEPTLVQLNYPIANVKKFVGKYIVGISNRTALNILDPYDMKVLVSVDSSYMIIDYHVFNSTSIMCCFENGYVKTIHIDYTC